MTDYLELHVLALEWINLHLLHSVKKDKTLIVNYFYERAKTVYTKLNYSKEMD